MNFSKTLKQEILSKRIKDNCCKKSFLAGLMRGTGQLFIEDDQLGLDFTVYDENLASLCAEYFRVLYDYEIREVSVGNDHLNNREIFEISIKGEKATEILTDLEVLALDGEEVIVNTHLYGELTKKECCLKSFIKGLFVAVGSCTLPSNEDLASTGYHAQFTFSHEIPAEETERVLSKYDITSKTTKRKGQVLLYIKSAEQIKNLFAFLGASLAVLNITDLMISREMINNTNRRTNCDMGNVSRQIEATMKQIEAIKILQKKNVLSTLKQELQLTAKLRLEKQDMSVIELANLLGVSKSCLNHRLKKLIELSKQ